MSRLCFPVQTPSFCRTSGGRWYVTSHFELHGFHLCYPSNIRTYESPTKPARIRYLAIRFMNLCHKSIVISQKVLRYAVWHQYLDCLTLHSHFAPEVLWTQSWLQSKDQIIAIGVSGKDWKDIKGNAPPIKPILSRGDGWPDHRHQLLGANKRRVA